MAYSICSRASLARSCSAFFPSPTFLGADFFPDFFFLGAIWYIFIHTCAHTVKLNYGLCSFADCCCAFKSVHVTWKYTTTPHVNVRWTKTPSRCNGYNNSTDLIQNKTHSSPSLMTSDWTEVLPRERYTTQLPPRKYCVVYDRLC